MNEDRYNIKQELKSDLWLMIIMIAVLLSAVLIYNRLPDKIPLHWNIEGKIDRYGSRSAIFLMPLLNIGIYVGMLFSPLIDPKRNNYTKFKGAYRTIRALFVVFFAVIYIVVAMASLGYAVKIDFIIPLGVSLLFTVIGNYMGKIRHNYFVGIKTPWTLADENVWLKTHRLGGRLWVAAGIIGVMGTFMGGKWTAALVIVPIIVASIIPIVYSYVLYSRSRTS